MSPGFTQQFADGLFAHGMHHRDNQQIFSHIAGRCKFTTLVTAQQRLAGARPCGPGAKLGSEKTAVDSNSRAGYIY
jgi:hypothetical protein